MAESLGVEMPVTASDYQSLIRIKELEERIAELEKDNAEQAKIITEQAKLITADQCDRCGSTNLEESGVEKEVIEEIPPPPKIEVIQFNWHKYQCQDADTSSQRRMRNAFRKADSA